VHDDGHLVSDAHESTPSDRLPIDPDVEERASDRASGRGSQARRALASRWDILAVIALGGALGSLGRWAVGHAFVAPRGGFPWATFVENLTGGFALGVLMIFILDVWPPSRYIRPFVGVGVLGGFTTWSTYMLDTRALVVADRTPMAALYLFGTLIGGVAAVWAGILLARLVAEPSSRPHHQSHNRSDDGLDTRRQS
jgi:fluoride exporter